MFYRMGACTARVISFKVEEVGFFVLAEEQGDLEGVNICCNSGQVHSTLTRTERLTLRDAFG